MKAIILILIVVIFAACIKEYFPDQTEYRDPDLCRTWVRLSALKSDLTFKENVNEYVVVFTEAGYNGTVSYFESRKKYQSLEGIWFTEKADVTNKLKYNRYHEKKRFRNGMYNHTNDYFFSKGKDSLFRKDVDFENKWDTLILYKYQLKYDGPDYVGLQSTK